MKELIEREFVCFTCHRRVIDVFLKLERRNSICCPRRIIFCLSPNKVRSNEGNLKTLFCLTYRPVDRSRRKRTSSMVELRMKQCQVIWQSKKYKFQCEMKTCITCARGRNVFLPFNFMDEMAFVLHSIYPCAM